MPPISVIIPCYNVENYIDRCVKSLINQSIGVENLELIFVNDASTDGTLTKLQNWEQTYPENIMVITYEENLRQGGARNVGLQYATGEYIGFVDSDDWIEPDMYELLYSIAKQKDFDQVCGKYMRNFSEEDSMPDDSNANDREYHFPQKGGYYINNADDFGNVGEKEVLRYPYSAGVLLLIMKFIFLKSWHMRTITGVLFYLCI